LKSSTGVLHPHGGRGMVRVVTPSAPTRRDVYQVSVRHGHIQKPAGRSGKVERVTKNNEARQPKS